MLFVDLFGLLMGRDFRQGIRVLPIILLANMFSGIWLNLSFWYKQSGQTQYAIWITGTGLVFTVGLNLALTPALGYPGAALARLGCETAMVAVSYYLNRKHCPTPYDLPRIGSYFLAGGAIYALSLLTVRLSPAAHYAASLRVACRTPRADRPKRVASLDRQALDCETALSEKRNAILVTNINRTVR